jgi:hypothetical protein
MIHENKIPQCLSQAFTSHHTKVFTLILSLSEGRAGILWVPSDKMLFLPPRYKAHPAFPQMFYLYFYTYSILPDTLSLFSFKGLNWCCRPTNEEPYIEVKTVSLSMCTSIIILIVFFWKSVMK